MYHVIKPATGAAIALLSLLSTFTLLSAQTTYYVIPSGDDPNVSCDPGDICLTLSEYTQNLEGYLTPNVAFEFLAGDHTLDLDVRIGADVQQISLVGRDSATSALDVTSRIVCTQPVSFAFDGVGNVTIASLAFIACGSLSLESPAVFYLFLVQRFELTNCHVRDSTNVVVDTTFSDSLLIRNNQFVANYAGVFRILVSNTEFSDNRFTDNLASDLVSDTGGAIYVSGSTLTFSGTNEFTGNLASYGGAVYAFSSDLAFSGNTSFISNSATNEGSGIHIQESCVTFNSRVSFENNRAVIGGGLYVQNSRVTFSDESIFRNNTALAAAAIYTFNSSLDFNGNADFVNNRGGVESSAIYAIQSSVSFTGSSLFADNYDSTQVYLMESTLVLSGNHRFMNNRVDYVGAALFGVGSNITLLKGDVQFVNNSVQYVGGAIHMFYSNLIFNGSSNFENNSASNGGAISTFQSTLEFNGNHNFTNNIASHFGGAFYSVGFSNVTFSNHGSFVNNSAMIHGGALSTVLDSAYFFKPQTTVYFENNQAGRSGGAISVENNHFSYCVFDPDVLSLLKFGGTDNYGSPFPLCFLQISGIEPGLSLPPDLDIHLEFRNNYAEEAGTSIYGGSIDICIFEALPNSLSGVIFDALVNITDEFNTSSSISSDPYRVCACQNDYINCSEFHVSVSKTVYPGQTFAVSIAAVGQRDGAIPTVVSAQFEPPSSSTLAELEDAQATSNTCTDLHYTVFSTGDSESITLYAQGPCSNFGLQFTILVSLLPCPSGFALSETARACVCEDRLQEYTNNCNINDQTILRGEDDDFWAGLDSDTNELILHPNCRFDYCKSNAVNFTLQNAILQCDHNRNDTLCGACQHGLSLTLGTSRCKKCSNVGLLLLIAFAVAGLALVFFLMTLRLTVAVGIINGLIFYANVIQVNRSVFFPSELTNPFTDIVSVFIAWLNLDFGIETCFYDGMDAYAQTWLQFIFPVYIWMLVGLIMLICKYSTQGTKLLGHNPVAVLATLFLLSYTKLLQTIIAAFSFTILDYPNGKTSTVWLYDGTVPFLDGSDGRHAGLFVASLLVFLILFVPYTLLLFSEQWVQRLTTHKWLSWMSNPKVKSFLDAYQAPYKDKHRYWTGLLLLVRLFLFIILAINSLGDPSVNLLVTTFFCLAVAFLAWNIGGVYKKWYLNVLESFFILKLVVFTSATYYIRANASGSDQISRQNVLVCILISTDLMIFIAIVTYSLCLQLEKKQVWDKIAVKKRFGRKHYLSDDSHDAVVAVSGGSSHVTTSSVKLSGPTVLGFDNSAVLREPMLEDNY